VIGIVIDPPLSFPTIVNEVEVVTVSDAFGTNLNLFPTTTCEVVEIKSPANDGTVLLELFTAFASKFQPFCYPK